MLDEELVKEHFQGKHVQVLETSAYKYLSKWGQCVEYILWLQYTRWHVSRGLRAVLRVLEVLAGARWRGVPGWLSLLEVLKVKCPKTSLMKSHVVSRSWTCPAGPLLGFYSNCVLHWVPCQDFALNPSAEQNPSLSPQPLHLIFVFYALLALEPWSPSFVGSPVCPLSCGHLLHLLTWGWLCPFYPDMERGAYLGHVNTDQISECGYAVKLLCKTWEAGKHILLLIFINAD